MFDNRSAYAQNKRDKDSIVYISVTGPVRLTRADFPSEAEFLKWKRWSDGDYHAAEKAGRCHKMCIRDRDVWDLMVGMLRPVISEISAFL